MTEQRYNTKDRWLPLMEFAMKHNISLSTLRRHIKAGKVTYKIEEGRYLLWHDETEVDFETEIQPEIRTEIRKDKNPHRMLEPRNTEDSVIELERNLKQAHEEIAELKTLIAFYEESMPPQQQFNG